MAMMPLEGGRQCCPLKIWGGKERTAWSLVLAALVFGCRGAPPVEEASSPRAQVASGVARTEREGETPRTQGDTTSSEKVTRQEVEDALRRADEALRGARLRQDEPAQILASLGGEAVPVLVDILRARSFRSPFTIVRALGLIGDQRALAVLSEMLRNESVPGYRDKILEAMIKIGGPDVEPLLLSVFRARDSAHLRLTAARALATTGSANSRREVREWASRVLELGRRTMTEAFLNERGAERELAAMGVSTHVMPGVVDVVIELGDAQLIMEAILWRQAWPPQGERMVRACQRLAESGTKRGIDGLFALVGDNTGFSPAFPSGREIVTRLEGKPYEELSEYEKQEVEQVDRECMQFRRVPHGTRIAAARALLSVRKQVNAQKLQMLLERLSQEIPDHRSEVETMLQRLGDGADSGDTSNPASQERPVKVATDLDRPEDAGTVDESGGRIDK